MTNDESCIPSSLAIRHSAVVIRKPAQSISSFRIFARKVCGLIRSNAAAPWRPSMRPCVSGAPPRCAGGWPHRAARFGGAAATRLGRQLNCRPIARNCRPNAARPPVAALRGASVSMPNALATSNRWPSPRIAARSITAPSSRTFPGQGYDINSVRSSGVGATGANPNRVAARSAKCAASLAMSSGAPAAAAARSETRRSDTRDPRGTALRPPSRPGRGAWRR